MKRLMIVTVLASVTLPMMGCATGGWPRLWWYRGDVCNSCTPYSAPYSSGTIIGDPVLPAPPADTELLPGPQESESST